MWRISPETNALQPKVAMIVRDFPGFRRVCHRIFMSREGRIAIGNPSLRVHGSNCIKTEAACARGGSED